MSRPGLARAVLRGTRTAIDAVDDGMLLLFALRRRLVRTGAALKRHARLPLRDPAREREVVQRALWLAGHIDVPSEAARGLCEWLVADACRQQGLAVDLGQGPLAGDAGMLAAMTPFAEPARTLLRLLPPPRRVAPWLRAIPLQALLLERALARVLAVCERDGSLDFMNGRRLGIDIEDLGISWVFGRIDGRLRVLDAAPEARVCGSLTDLLLLAGRLEDADTLFFQRRLALTGDTELGLTLRNLLERLPWETVPLGLRIVLNRGARFARAARAAHRGETDLQDKTGASAPSHAAYSP